MLKKLGFLAALAIVIISLLHFYGFNKARPPKMNLLTRSTSPAIDHFVLILMENYPRSAIINNPQAPFLNDLAQKYISPANYYGVTHPSLPNYLALLGGSTFGVSRDCTDCFISKSNLIDTLENAGLSWKAYLESMPNSCFLGDRYPYVQKHNPFIYFDDLRNNPSRCSKIVPFDSLFADLKSVNTSANFIWVSPDSCHDMHDCSIAAGDSWLQAVVPAILNSPIFQKQKSLLIITWDEDDKKQNNNVPFLAISPKLKLYFDSRKTYTHYSLLRFIETSWGLPFLTENDRSAVQFTISP